MKKTAVVERHAVVGASRLPAVKGGSTIAGPVPGVPQPHFDPEPSPWRADPDPSPWKADPPPNPW
jgi:hypothetical protein